MQRHCLDTGRAIVQTAQLGIICASILHTFTVIHKSIRVIKHGKAFIEWMIDVRWTKVNQFGLGLRASESTSNCSTGLANHIAREQLHTFVPVCARDKIATISDTTMFRLSTYRGPTKEGAPVISTGHWVGDGCPSQQCNKETPVCWLRFEYSWV